MRGLGIRLCIHISLHLGNVYQIEIDTNLKELRKILIYLFF